MVEPKWHLEVFEDSRDNPYYLAPLPESKAVANNYIHKPGDIDYSELAKLPNEYKARILYWLLINHISEFPCDPAARIAGVIFIDRLSNPEFVPKELNPNRWKW